MRPLSTDSGRLSTGWFAAYASGSRFLTSSHRSRPRPSVPVRVSAKPPRSLRAVQLDDEMPVSSARSAGISVQGEAEGTGATTARSGGDQGLKRENFELRARRDLKAASVFFATELDAPTSERL